MLILRWYRSPHARPWIETKSNKLRIKILKTVASRATVNWNDKWLDFVSEGKTGRLTRDRELKLTMPFLELALDIRSPHARPWIETSQMISYSEALRGRLMRDRELKHTYASATHSSAPAVASCATVNWNVVKFINNRLFNRGRLTRDRELKPI